LKYWLVNTQTIAKHLGDQIWHMGEIKASTYDCSATVLPKPS